MSGSGRRSVAKAVMGRAGETGFTLIETLIAMALAGMVLLPASIWLYHSRASRAALEKFRATQALEAELQRAVLLRSDHGSSREVPGPPFLRLEVRVHRDADEVRLSGKALDRRGRALAELEAAYFTEMP
jgi:prepilin-type N-terminal cleavage/methylation domain-containing protein